MQYSLERYPRSALRLHGFHLRQPWNLAYQPFPLAKILAVRKSILQEAEVREVVNDALFDNVETGVRNERFRDFNPFWCLVVFK
jgi:hypothetical protein